MNPELKEKLTDSSVWIRFIYSVFFFIILHFLWWVAVLGAGVQFIFLLLKREANADLAKFLTNLSHYFGQVAKYACFVSEDKPFPFRSWEER